MKKGRVPQEFIDMLEEFDFSTHCTNPIKAMRSGHISVNHLR